MIGTSTRWRRRPALRGLAVAAALALAGCTGGQPSDPSASATASATVGTTPPATDTSDGPVPSGSHSPSGPPERELPEPPHRPDAMDDTGVDGAIAAAKYFISLYPYVYATGDLTEWERMSHPECVFCKSVIDNVTNAQELGHRSEGPEITILDEWGRDPLPGNEFFAVDLNVLQGASQVLDARGDVIEAFEPEELLVYFALTRDDETWRLREVSSEAAG